MPTVRNGLAAVAVNNGMIYVIVGNKEAGW
jgi:hypothetical protein